MNLVPVTIRGRSIQIEDNKVLVNGILVDSDARLIQAITDQKVNHLIEQFSGTYVVDVTARCNAECPYCYYKVDNASVDRAAENIIEEALKSGFNDICLMGAEPTVRKDLPEIIKVISDAGKKVGITTNGKRLLSRKYLSGLVDSGLGYLNYSMHFSEDLKLSRAKIRVLRNIVDARVPICQLAFTVSSLNELKQAVGAIDIIDSFGVAPSQFVIRAGAAIGNCKTDSCLQMSAMIKTLFSLGAIKMMDGGSNLYFCELLYKGHNLHLVRWPTNETVTPYSKTGPIFGTPLGPMLSPVFQFVSSLSPAQLERERKLLS